MVKNIAIIPARGGSKRIPKKNIVDFYGKPMIAWTIEAALKSEVFSHVIVSTDDEEISRISKQYGAEVPFYRNKYADDHSSISFATINCLLQAQDYFSEKFDHIVQLMANCPLRTCEDIIKSYNYFIEQNSKLQVSVFKFGWMNPWWATKNNSGNFDFIFPEAIKNRSQDLEDLFCPTGAIWIAKSSELINSKSYYTDKTTMCELKWENALDIDDYNDLKMAKAIAPNVYKIKNKQTFGQ